MPRYYRSSYYTPGNPKELYDGDKILLISHLDSLDLNELIKQQNIYKEQVININNYFNGEEFKDSEKKIKESIKNLKSLLKDFINEIKIVSDRKFYKIKKKYFEKKKLFGKNFILLEIKYYAKDEKKGDKFINISKSIAKELKNIQDQTEIFFDRYEEILAILKSHNLLSSYHQVDDDIQEISIKNLNEEEKQILNIKDGVSPQFGCNNDVYKDYQISKKIPKFFIDSMMEHKDLNVDHNSWWEPEFKPDFLVDYKEYFNESKFMKNFLQISKDFSIPQISLHKPERKVEAIEISEKILRRIELTIRAKKKGEEKMINVGYVYVLSNKAYPNVYKIGSTYGLPEERAEELTGTGHLTPFIVVAHIKIKNAEYNEKLIHRFLKKDRVKKGREFFRINLKEIKDILKKVDKMSDKGKIKISLSDLSK